MPRAGARTSSWRRPLRSPDALEASRRAAAKPGLHRIQPTSATVYAGSCGAEIVSRRRIVLGQHVSLVASDGFKLGAYRAEPSGPAKGGVVVIQEIFGVNHHIRAVCDRLAAEGYIAEAPALFDRQQ